MERSSHASPRRPCRQAQYSQVTIGQDLRVRAAPSHLVAGNGTPGTEAFETRHFSCRRTSSPGRFRHGLLCIPTCNKGVHVQFRQSSASVSDVRTVQLRRFVCFTEAYFFQAGSQVVSEEKQEERPERAEDGRRQHGHCPPTSTQRRNLGETGETKGGGWQDRRPHQQTLKCKRSQQNSEEWNRYKRPPSEQEYSEDVSQLRHGLNVKPTREELNHLSKACCRLWELDLNRLLPGKDYRIECGQGKKVYQKGDMASENLFSWLKDDILHRPTYSRFCALLDNYNPRQGYKELVTQQDKNEEAAFIEEIARSAPIKYLHQYLVLKGITSQDQKDFKKMLASLWFDLYGRGGCSGSSSAFEHVFVGEIKGRCRGENEVTGFHNWIQFYLEESKGNVDYQGYIFPRTCGDLPDSEMQLLTIQFEWHGLLKSVSSTLVGVSPEFEIALYTLCFFAGEENNHVHVGPYALNIKCYRMGVNKIGSAFPVAEQ